MSNTIKYNNNEYYLGEYIKQNNPLFFTSCKTAKEIIKKIYIEESNYIYIKKSTQCTKKINWEIQQNNTRGSTIAFLKQYADENIKNVSRDSLKKMNMTNINGRAGSTRNGAAKDIIKNIYNKKWSHEDDIIKNNHFKDCKTFKIVLDKNNEPIQICNYCGKQNNEKHKFDKEHLVPSCNTTDSIYGADHNGNIFISCKECNCIKGSKLDDGFEWITDLDVRKKFVEYYLMYKDKLLADKSTIQKIEASHKITNKTQKIIALHARVLITCNDNSVNRNTTCEIHKKIHKKLDEILELLESVESMEYLNNSVKNISI